MRGYRLLLGVLLGFLATGGQACLFNPSGVLLVEPDGTVPETCGNGVLDQGEACDGEDLGGASCTSIPGGFIGGILACAATCHYDTTSCIPAGCGDQVVSGVEECDDGNDSNEDECLNDCTLARCGDGFVRSGQEACDDGNSSPDDGCSATCQVEPGWDCAGNTCVPICGDSQIVGDEECDDGGTTPGDGCSSLCTVEDFYACEDEPSVCTCVVYVDRASAAGTPTGASWATALPGFQSGLDTASGRASTAGTSCAVWVAAGTYSTSTTYSLRARVLVFGGFAGVETARAQRDIRANVTTLDGQDQADSVLTANLVDEARLDGFTVTRGMGSGYGGGVWLKGQDLTIANCLFEENTAGNDGGGIYVTADSSVTVSRCRVLGNTAGSWGGGLLVRLGGSAVVTDSLFAHNIAGAGGGGLYVEDGNSVLQVVGCTLTGNDAGAFGSGIQNEGATLTVTNSILWGDGTDEIHTNGGATTVSWSTIQGGHAGDHVTEADPLFVNPTTDSYALQPASPCIDAANGDAASPWDIRGLARWDAPVADTGIGTPPWVDLGAFEHQP